MFGNLFLSSVFKRLNPIRDFVWREVQKQSMLKCISFQTEHVVIYPETIRGEIQDAVNESDFFIVLIGPQYGTKISRSGLPSDGRRKDWDLSFGHWELELALQRLKRTTKAGSKAPMSNPTKRLLLVNLVTARNSSSPDLRVLRDYAAAQARRLGVIFETIPVRLTNSSGSDDGQYVVNDKPTWEAKLRGFLARANELAGELMHEKALKSFQINRKRNIHVAGWSGIEEDKLYEAFVNDGYHNDSFSFLTMDRSLIEVPSSTRYYPRLDHPYLHFDFLFSDIEVVNFHKERGYIGPLPTYDGGNYIRDRFADTSFSVNIQRHRESFYPSEQLHAVPLLYGFNEIIVRANSPILKATKNGGHESGQISYSAFDLPTLLSKGYRVALWGWWVVTFPIILLAHATAVFEQRRAAGKPFTDFPGLKETHIQTVRTFSDWIMTFARNSPQEFELCIGLLVSSIRSAHRQIATDPARPTVIRSLDTLTSDLRNGEADVVLGGTSAVLATCRETRRAYETIIPREGVFTWINCICPTPNAEADFLGKIVEHWSEPDTQIRLSLGVGANEAFDPSALTKQYVGIPANRVAEKIFCNKIRSSPQLGSIHRTLRVLNARSKADTSLDLSWLRPFPHEQAAFLMEYFWNVLTRDLNADFRR